jgi:two-component system, OmpR family, response regulator CpxR
MAVITISRGIKSGGGELAGLLAKRLGYETIDREVIDECSRKYNIVDSDLLEELEATPGLWQRMTREHGRQLIYIKCALLDIIKRDNVIYYGQAGQLFLAGISNVLKLRLETPREERIQAVMNELKKNRDEAVEYIDNVDKHRSRWVKMLYDEDWYDPSLYDLVINSQNMSHDTICDLVVLAVESDGFKTSEKSTRRLNNLSLECEVKAAIASDDKVWEQPITVTCDEGIVTLRGMVKNKDMKARIAETASQVKGVNSCDVQITLASDPISKGKYGHE